MNTTTGEPQVRCKKLLESLAVRLERRAREMEKARAFNDEERTQRRSMVVIYMEISRMLRAELVSAIDMNAVMAKVEASLRWKGRCKCKDCERIRRAGGVGYDGISNRDKPKTPNGLK